MSTIRRVLCILPLTVIMREPVGVHCPKPDLDRLPDDPWLLRRLLWPFLSLLLNTDWCYQGCLRKLLL